VANHLLHAITSADDGSGPPTLDGLRGQRILSLREDVLIVWATEFSVRPDVFGREDMLQHHAIVSSIHGHVDACLPARFPTWLDAAALHRRAQALKGALDRVRGRSELAVTVLWLEPESSAGPPEATTPGRRYLLARRHALAGSARRRARAGELADAVEHHMRPDVFAIERTLTPSAEVAVSIALLTPRDQSGDLTHRLARVAFEDARILVNGPWPPYTFADVS
jgi:gas vesicle protein GvpL/GvpF